MNAVEVSYQVKGSGPALYMVHGIGSRKVTWDGIVPELEGDFTCVTYDLRGHGDSPVGTVPYSLEDMVNDLEALREKLGHEQIHVIGHSLGGMIGPAYAKAYPDRTLSVGLLSTAAGRTEDDSAKLRNVINLMEEKGVMPVIKTLVERWYTDEFIDARPDLIEMRMKQVEDTPEAVFLSVFWMYGTTEMAPWLHEIKCPCLVLTGELDGGCNPRLNRFINSQLSDSELVILDGLKHSILIEASQRVVPPLKAFLLRVRG